MKSFYNDEALLVFNDLLYKKRRELSDIRKYKFNSKFRSTQRQSESPNEYHNKGPESLLPVVNRDKNKKTPKYYLNFVQLASIMILKFAVEYGFSIEMVFISPLFLKLDTPDLLDSSIWLFPPVMNLMLYPFVRHMSESKDSHGYSRLLKLKRMMIYFIAISLLGIGLLADTRSICEYLVALDQNQKTGVLIVSIISFIIMDVGLEMLQVEQQNNQFWQSTCNILLSDFVHPRQMRDIEYLTVITVSFGKFVGFLVSSVLAFNFIYLNFDNFIQNLSLAYLVGLIIMLLGSVIMGLSFPSSRLEVVPNTQKIKLSLNSFLPGITIMRSVPREMKILLLSHFLTCGSQLFVSVYATLWSGITMLEDGPQQYNRAIRNIVFDIGISWGRIIQLFLYYQYLSGALALCLGALLHLLTTLFIHQVKSIRSLKVLYILVNTLAGITLLYTWLLNEFYTVFITLPFWGISIAVLQETPQRIALDIEKKTIKHMEMKGIFPQMLETTTFLAQLVMFFLIPLGFLIIIDLDDISASLFISSLFSFVGSLLACLL